MGSYRIEVSANNRAGCNAPACKKTKVKILKGELRLGSWVETEKFQSWSWRHWGCVTTKVISNIVSSLGDGDEPDFDLLDGLDELPEEEQDKVKQALKDGDIDESDRTVREDEAGDEAAEKPAEEEKPATKSKKRARAGAEAAEEVVPKKTKKTAGKAAVKDEAADEKPAKRGRAGKAAEEPAAAVEDAPKKARGRKKKTAAAEEESVDDAEPEPAPPAKKARKEATNGEKAKRGRRPKRAAKDE
ncbi:poly polymerase and DNA-ligase Zn-finger region-domain-containing protein [Talaromyces proteolyticus]|uniref:Poly polymerase and DNA-ligase Zn-finger region-domain-containing protein n=1 Tax=Talaromyces proteolyticus TaxID=1131652 RepID=A0AAD4KNB0_9EURO|nr:poly polymerase and DNA-ligase Zn-finger region-domain-containing protein [Talaromyces proteolyticus]KAH8695491.1 poly polymerase and DNA-ligase Zn-finger region-domain-containing protein [Talaromyces proteolyticus]